MADASGNKAANRGSDTLRTDWTRKQLQILADTRPRKLVTIVIQLQERVRELQARLAQNSQNSSKPPSSDGYAKPAPKSLREKSGRTSGGQPGHPGHTLKPVEKPDHIEIHPLMRCPCGCGGSLENQSVVRYEKRQVFDLPPLKLEVTEHRAEVKVCPHSGLEVTAAFPAGVSAPVQYGARWKGWLVYLRVLQLLPLRRIRQLCADLFGCAVSEATVEGSVVAAYKALAGFNAEVIRQLLVSPVAHADETGMRVTGKLHWFHVLSTGLITWFGVHPKRGHEALDAFGILPRFTGRLIHDFFESYFRYLCRHGMCIPHILRELKFLHEQCRQSWAGKMRELLLEMRRFVLERKQQTGTLTQAQRKRWIKRYRALLKEGFAANPPAAHQPGKRGRAKQSKAYNLLQRLKLHERDVLAFLYDLRVPFSNNQAERDFRMVKVQQKISGTFRILAGAEYFARVRSYLSTARKQDHNAFAAMIGAMSGQPFMPRAPT
ncbi:MAG: IS66 family transposase [Planctomycetota bacterium]